MSSEYEALVEKVSQFTRSAFERARGDMVCGAGCAGCCAVWLTVDQVEGAALREALAALPSDARARIAARGRAQLAREQSATDTEPSARQDGDAPRCALLESDGTCAAYAARPLVCRTQGHALRYPAGFIPEAAVRARDRSGEVTHCPLNFTQRAPAPESVLDAERVDQILAVVNRRFALAAGLDPLARHAISALAAECEAHGEGGRHR